jgi:hypothetical protein
VSTKDLPLGVYLHRKSGGVYTVLGVVSHHETREQMVLYLSHANGSWNVRPLYGRPGDPDGFLDHVMVNGGEGPRFVCMYPKDSG